MSQEERYLIKADIHGMVIGPKDGQWNPLLEITAKGRLTEEELRRDFGDRSITALMCLESKDFEGFTIYMNLWDVMSRWTKQSGWNDSYQDRVINALLKDAGSEKLEHSEMVRRARDETGLTPRSAEFLLQCAASGIPLDDMDPEHIVAEAKMKGFTISDFLREEPVHGEAVHDFGLPRPSGD